MRQTRVNNAAKWVFFYWEKRNVPNMRQTSVKNASKIFGGEHLLDDTDLQMGAHPRFTGVFRALVACDPETN